jgi:amino acid transporter
LRTTKVHSALPPRDPSAPKKISPKLTLWPLVAATFFMVSGGTYGTEDIVHGAGYKLGILVLVLTPLLWSLPTALMVGELATALPADGGYYVWVRRAMGNFWGFQEAWLSLVASIFDMALYPTLFVAYLSRLIPWFNAGHRGVMVGLVFVTVCTLMNLAGIRVVTTTSLGLFLLLSVPFAVIVLLAPFKIGAFAGAANSSSTSTVGLLGALLIAMWNYMGWDAASTIAADVANPRRTYPRAMFLAVTIVSLSYLLPVSAMWITGVPSSAFDTGSWANFAALVGGPWLRTALVFGGMISAFGMFNALVMSYSRLPLAMAEDGMLPKVFATLHPKTRAPWVAIITCAIGWGTCLELGFERLISIDVLLTGLSLLLEFAALVALRVREPNLVRPFRIPGGTLTAVLLGVCPALLLVFSAVRSHQERIFGMNGLAFGVLLIIAGIGAYYLGPGLRAAKNRL